MDEMKIYFTNSLLRGCYYVRCLLPMRELGADGDRTSMRSEVIPEEMRARAVLDADLVVFHRPNDDRSLKIAEMLRKQGKKIVMDNDDTYKGFDQTKLGKLFPKIDQAVDNFGRFADLITCSTEKLKEEYLKLNPNVVVLPNCVDPDDWSEPERNEGDKVRIGLVGSVGMLGDMTNFAPTLRELVARPDVQIVLLALPPRDETTIQRVQKMYEPEYAFWDAFNFKEANKVEWHHFVPQYEYNDKINDMKLDILVIPRADDYFNRCKSNLKFLEASMLEIPVVAQGFSTGDSPYQDPEDAKYMEIILDNSKWMDVLIPLIENKEKRQAMGKKAREYVIERYSISKNIHKWKEAYATL